MSETIHQEVTFKASPAAIYTALMTTKGHTDFSGEPATMSNKVGGKFTAYSGYISGINIELIKDKLIVQAWRANGWPKGHWSIVTCRLAKLGKGTKLTFTHSGVPNEEVASISSGWHQHYWEPLAKLPALA